MSNNRFIDSNDAFANTEVRLILHGVRGSVVVVVSAPICRGETVEMLQT